MIYIAQYRGLSPISRAIQHVTRGPYSHSALMSHCGAVIEAWHRGGVTANPDPWTIHTAGTPIDLFYASITDIQSQIIWRKALSQVGKEYDYWAIPGFLPLLSWLSRPREDAWFCAELVAWAFDVHGSELFSAYLAKHTISPSLIAGSPRLTMAGTVRDIGELDAWRQRQVGHD